MIEQARLFDPPQQVLDGPPVLSAYVGKNAGLFSQIMRLHVPEGSRVLDMTYGLGNFWDTPGIKERYRLVSMDMERPAAVRGVMEYPPFKPESFDCVVLDPPYANQGGEHAAGSAHPGKTDTYNLKRGTSHRAVFEMYRTAIYAGAKLLPRDGVFLVKCQDTLESVQHWVHVYVLSFGLTAGLDAVDLFVLVQDGTPAMRHPYQKHARKNHSYFWVFKKGGD